MKKYNNLHPSLIERINYEERFAKNPAKSAKTRLHQLYGAYIQPNSNKKASALIEQLAKHSPTIQACKNETVSRLLQLHASTNERLPYYSNFYKFIFSHTGTVNKVLDIGCGFNPFSLPFFPQQPTEYHAVDIDMHTKDLLNAFFEIMRLPKYATCEDLETFTPQAKVDLALMLKLFPILETNTSGRAYSLADNLNTSWLVITFPTKSLGGKKKGMSTHYRTSFQDAVNKNNLGNFNVKADTIIGNELLFLLKNNKP